MGTEGGPEVDDFVSDSPAILRAYHANDLSKPLFASNQAGLRGTAGVAVKFATPTIANGMVYVGAQNEVDAYGLLPNAGGASHSVATTAATPERRVVGSATPAGPASTRFARTAHRSSRRAPGRVSGGDQPLVTLSGNGITTRKDSVVSQWGNDTGLGSLSGSRMKGPTRLSRT